MPKTSELTGALLDYWTGKAEKKPVRLMDGVCVRDLPFDPLIGPLIGADYVGFYPSTNWAHCGPLISKWDIFITARAPGEITVSRCTDEDQPYPNEETQGTTEQEAICRAVVRAAFGDEVPEVAP